MGSRYLRRLARHLGPDGGVVERQLPFVGLFLVALLTLLIPGVAVASQTRGRDRHARSRSASWSAARLPAVGRWPEGAQDVLPMLQLLAVAFLRTGTGGPGSPYTTLVFFPVITLASQRGRRGVVLGVARRRRRSSSRPACCSATSRVHGGHRRPDPVRHARRGRRRRHRARDHRPPAGPQQGAAVAADGPGRAARPRPRRRRRAGPRGRPRRAARDQLVSVIDSATEQAIIATDATGLVEVFNAGAERLLGYGQGEVVGRMRLTDFHDRDELEARRSAALRRRLAGRQPAGARRRARRPALAGRPEVRDWTYVARDGVADDRPARRDPARRGGRHHDRLRRRRHRRDLRSARRRGSRTSSSAWSATSCAPR